MRSIYWARHGQNEANLTRTLSHRRYDKDLTGLGQAQAASLAMRLAGDPAGIAVIVSSPLRRARQTADIIAARLGVPVAAEFEELRELNVGSLDGRSDDEAWSRYEQVLGDWRAGRSHARFPGGEDQHELTDRLRWAMSSTLDLAAGANAVIVAHGGSIRAALPGLTGLPDPGHDLATGCCAHFAFGEPGAPPRLWDWPASPD